MDSYQNLGGNSGVVAYEIGDDYIDVRFKDGMCYLYNYASTGAANVERMKNLAEQGHGLNSFISRSIKTNFASKRRC